MIFTRDGLVRSADFYFLMIFSFHLQLWVKHDFPVCLSLYRVSVYLSMWHGIPRVCCREPQTIITVDLSKLSSPPLWWCWHHLQWSSFSYHHSSVVCCHFPSWWQESTETHHQTQTSTKKRIHKEEVEQYEKKNLPQSPEDSPSPTIDEILPGGYKLSSDREKTILEDYPILVGKIKDDKAWKTSNFLSIKGYGRKDTKRDCDQVDSRNEEAINGTIRKNKRKRWISC